MNDDEKKNSFDLAELETYRRVFYASPDYISISRLKDGTYIDVNPGYERFTGYTRQEVIGKTSSDLNIWVDSTDRSNFVQSLASKGELHGYATRLRNRRGEIRSIEASVTTVEIGGEPVLVAIVRDVTERKGIELELEQYRGHLELLVAERTVELVQANGKLVETNRRLEEAHARLQETEKRIRHMAQHDVLTGLPNRALLEDRVSQAIALAMRNKKAMALFFIDLDKFKQVNDSLGHEVGDHLLCMVAERLRQCVRASDTVARIGGDEFVICLTGLDNAAQAGLVAQKVLDSLKPLCIIDGHALQAGGSVGISVYPTDGVDAAELMKAADTAMYNAKASGRGNFQFAAASSRALE